MPRAISRTPTGQKLQFGRHFPDVREENHGLNWNDVLLSRHAATL